LIDQIGTVGLLG